MAPQLKRGFATWCENASSGYRRDLGLAAHSPLNSFDLAKHLSVDIWEPSDVPGLDADTVNHLTKTDSESWSAVTIRVGQRYLIIHNGTHLSGRRNYTLAHELAHIILKHPPARMFYFQELMVLNHYNPEHEAEADCLAGALVVPRAALLAALEANNSLEWCAEHFGVSLELVRMRKNLTGIGRQLSYRNIGKE